MSTFSVNRSSPLLPNSEMLWIVCLFYENYHPNSYHHRYHVGSKNGQFDAGGYKVFIMYLCVLFIVDIQNLYHLYYTVLTIQFFCGFYASITVLFDS